MMPIYHIEPPTYRDGRATTRILHKERFCQEHFVKLVDQSIVSALRLLPTIACEVEEKLIGLLRLHTPAISLDRIMGGPPVEGITDYDKSMLFLLEAPLSFGSIFPIVLKELEGMGFVVEQDIYSSHATAAYLVDWDASIFPADSCCAHNSICCKLQKGFPSSLRDEVDQALRRIHIAKIRYQEARALRNLNLFLGQS